MTDLEIDLTMTSDLEPIADGNWVWMYLRMQHATEETQYETASCLVQYRQADSADTLTADEIKALASV